MVSPTVWTANLRIESIEEYVKVNGFAVFYMLIDRQTPSESDKVTRNTCNEVISFEITFDRLLNSFRYGHLIHASA
jgi:hypothetical protein